MPGVFSCCMVNSEIEGSTDSDSSLFEKELNSNQINMSGIEIKVKAGDSMSVSSVTATGYLQHIITDSERYSFGIGSDADLKRAVGNYFGKQPNDAYLHSPTPWGDLYKSYGWQQTQTILKPIQAVVLEVDSKPVILAKKTLKNESDKEATFTTGISEQVTDSVSNTWSSSSKVAFSQMIKYQIGFLGTEGGGQTTFTYEQQWGSSETKTHSTTVGTQTGISVVLKPGESAEVELGASSGRMQVEITYEAYLIGSSAVNYNPTYQGHHFWDLAIEPVVGSDNNRIKITERLEIGYYSNAQAIIKDGKGQILYTFPHVLPGPKSETQVYY